MVRKHLDHAQLFFTADGAPIRDLSYPYACWHRTLRSLAIRYRKPNAARHSSVSWDLLIGRNPLFVAKQHGHSLTTMLSIYAAWVEGAQEVDIDAIRAAMNVGATGPSLPTAGAADALVFGSDPRSGSSLAVGPGTSVRLRAVKPVTLAHGAPTLLGSSRGTAAPQGRLC
jgi:hypothetical protein